MHRHTDEELARLKVAIEEARKAQLRQFFGPRPRQKSRGTGFTKPTIAKRKAKNRARRKAK